MGQAGGVGLGIRMTLRGPLRSLPRASPVGRSVSANPLAKPANRQTPSITASGSPDGVAHLIMSLNVDPRCRRSASRIASDPQFSQLSDRGANSPGSGEPSPATGAVRYAAPTNSIADCRRVAGRSDASRIAAFVRANGQQDRRGSDFRCDGAEEMADGQPPTEPEARRSAARFDVGDLEDVVVPISVSPSYTSRSGTDYVVLSLPSANPGPFKCSALERADDATCTVPITPVR